MIEVKMAFSSAAEMVAFFGAHTVGKITPPMTPPAADVPTPALLGQQVDLTPPKPSRKKKEVAVDQAPQPAVSEPEPESETKYTIDEVRVALQNYVGKTDFAAGTALVQKFKKDDGTPAMRLTELRECDYAAFIEATKK